MVGGEGSRKDVHIKGYRNGEISIQGGSERWGGVISKSFTFKMTLERGKRFRSK